MGTGNDNRIDGNRVFDNRRDGVTIGHDGERTVAERNRVVLNGGHGISGGNHALIRHNFVSRNGADGIGGFGHSRVARNVVSHNVAAGVSPGGSHNQIERNVVSGNATGIWLDEPNVTENTLEGNRVSASESEGIYVLEHADSNLIRGNRVFRNGGAEYSWATLGTAASKRTVCGATGRGSRATTPTA